MKIQLSFTFILMVLAGCSKSDDSTPAPTPSSPNVALELLGYLAHANGSVYYINKFTPNVGNSVGGIGAGSLRVQETTGDQLLVLGHKFLAELPQKTPIPRVAPADEMITYSIAAGDTMATVYSADRRQVINVFIALQNAKISLSSDAYPQFDAATALLVFRRGSTLRVITIPK